MNQLDLKLSATFTGPLDLTGWHLTKRSIPRGVMLLTLAMLSWAALCGAAWFLFFSGR